LPIRWRWWFRGACCIQSAMYSPVRCLGNLAVSLMKEHFRILGSILLMQLCHSNLHHILSVMCHARPSTLNLLLQITGSEIQCRDSILYRLVLAYFTAHDHWASQHNITIMCRAIPHIMCSFLAITHQAQDTFLHSRDGFPRSHIFASHRASLCLIAHLCVSSRFSVHHRRSIHPLSSQFLGALHSIYYYI